MEESHNGGLEISLLKIIEKGRWTVRYSFNMLKTVKNWIITYIDFIASLSMMYLGSLSYIDLISGYSEVLAFAVWFIVFIPALNVKYYNQIRAPEKDTPRKEIYKKFFIYNVLGLTSLLIIVYELHHMITRA